MTWDPITNERILTLDSRLQPIATDFVNQCFDMLHLKVRITEAFRSLEKQHMYYEQGRSEPGKIITNADAGLSFHNYGLAFDICVIVLGKLSWEFDMHKVATLGVGLGLNWGGFFKFKDYCHFEKSFGHTISYYFNRRPK